MDEEINKFKRHCGESTKLVLTGADGKEDFFELYPLGASELMGFMPIYQYFTKINKDKVPGAKITKEDSLKAFTNMPVDIFKSLSEMCKKTIKKSYPKLDDEVIDVFVGKNFNQLMPIVLALNSYTKSSKKGDKK